ncbi:ATP-binding protein [Anaerocolumna sp. AGMB13025]|uniref:ATP-binding protein n=1 Tax=Anaerocolumna sp. AGMB13025 TaxID=3039116 RepID=UPI00241C3D85|nr:ATP-binding protein [Anaerocolumna sp. AGMB13025]WFR59010.1 ATP-binding protein [Anaerocolumna sp. AGMB13025]
MNTLRDKKLLLLLIITVLLLPISITFMNHKEKVTPKGEKGFLDLSNWDFNQEGSVKLDGYWELYTNTLLTPQELDNNNVPPSYALVPGRWSYGGLKEIQKDDGIGTYRLKIKVNQKLDILGLRIKNIRLSYKIFVNGKEVAACGNPAPDEQSGYIANNLPMTVFFPLSKGDGDTAIIDLVIQAANIHYYNGGIIQSIYLGNQKDINWEYNKEMLMDVMISSFLILTSIYCFVIFLRKRDEKKLLYMSLFYISLAYIIATANAKVLLLMTDFVPYLVDIKIRTAIVAVNIIFICLFIQDMSRELISDLSIKLIVIIMCCCMAVTLLVPYARMAIFEKAVTVVYLLTYSLVALRLVYCIVKKRHGGIRKNTVIFLLFLDLQFINEYISSLLYYYSVVKSFLLSNIIYLLLLLVLCYLFADQYMKAYKALKIMNADLIAADKIKDDFLAYASNEFKSPLNAITNITRSILNDEADTSLLSQKENLLYVLGITVKMSDLVNDIMDYQNLKNNKLKFNKRDFDIYGLVNVVLETVRYMSRDTVVLKNEIPKGRYFITADEHRLEQIIHNLIGYSLKGSEEGTVKIKGQEFDGYIGISLWKTGRMMEDKVQQELFKEYTPLTAKGIGDNIPAEMGIYVSKLLAVNMGGDIYVESKGEKESAFIIRMPKARRNRQTGRPGNKTGFKSRAEKENVLSLKIPKTGDAEFKSHKKPKILLADDDVVTLKLLFDICKEEFEPVIAYNGRQALEIIQKDRDISLALVDVVMPDISGYEVCRQIRELYTLLDLPILLLTVRNATEDIETGLMAGANDFLVKPFHAKELINRVKTLRKMQEALQSAVKIETVFLQSQIKQHFLYNSLNSIVSLCYSDPERAGNLLGELSHYLRSILEIDPHHSFIEIKKEISLIKSYLELEKARFGERLKILFDYDQSILKYQIPAFLVQPIVENAIRHGIMGRMTGGTVAISMKKKESKLVIKIKDDGVGIEKEKLGNLLQETSQGSIGLKNVNKRLMNEYGESLYIQSEIDKGTSIMIRIPVS